MALLSDTHSTRSPNGEHPQYQERLNRVIAAVNAADVSLVLVAGDLTNGARAEQMLDFRAQIRGFKAPVLFVAGNHDVGNRCGLGRRGQVGAKKVALFEKELGPSFFATEQSGVRVVGLNASLPGSGLPREAEQWTFLERALARPSPVPTLVLLHYPLFVEKPDERDNPRLVIDPASRARLIALFQAGGVCGVLSGHAHWAIKRMVGGITYITTPAVAYGSRREPRCQGWTLLTLSGERDVQAEFRYETTDPTQLSFRRSNGSG
ncbi:MAG: metallophosphoesterase [Chloroflexi bacterium]|nr:metallophosphoesterase [Chloroflexota bacterium]